MTKEEREDAIEFFKKVAEKEVDGAKYSKLAIKALEQEPVLDKIRAEIERMEYLNIEDGSDGYDHYVDKYDVLQIIDKYKAESENQEPCDKCEVGNPCLYCKHEFEPQENEG